MFTNRNIHNFTKTPKHFTQVHKSLQYFTQLYTTFENIQSSTELNTTFTTQIQNVDTTLQHSTTLYNTFTKKTTQKMQHFTTLCKSARECTQLFKTIHNFTQL